MVGGLVSLPIAAATNHNGGHGQGPGRTKTGRHGTCMSVLMTTFALEFLFILCFTLHLLNTRGAGAFLEFIRDTNDTATTEGPAEETGPSPSEFLEDFSKYCRRKVVWYPPDVDSRLPLCPCIPRTLVGQQHINLSEPIPTWEEINDEFVNLTRGGHFRPPDCVARHRTAIIVPFRDRDSHLRLFLSHMHSFLQRQEIDYRIFVVEQVGLDVFNKAMMMNIGFKEASRMYNFDCYIFHDVDMLPENDHNIYTCSEDVRHVGSHCDKWNYKVPYKQLFGGAIALSRHQFQSANGFSNLYYGWGGEDDDMFRRVVTKKMKIVRYSGSVARYTMIKHSADKGNPYNVHSGKAWGWRPNQYKKDGLNTLSYELNKVENRTLYTWVYASIPPPPYVVNPQTLKASSANENVYSYVLFFCLIMFLIVPR